MKKIRDTVYGDYIEINEDQLRVIDSKEFQRLRRIKQLGFSSITYPGANHTRFEHSLGVLYLTKKVCKNIDVLTKEKQRDLEFAALLHDIGHGPFSHVSEFISEKYGTSHEELSAERVHKMEDIINGDIDRIINYIKGEDLQIVAGHIDTDRMDYLKRDSLKCGIEHGNIELPTISHAMNIIDGNIVFNENSLSAIESLLVARSHMINSVYTHHASMCAELMVKETLQAYCEEESIEKMMSLDDYDAKKELLNMDRKESKYFKKVLNRNLYKVAYQAGIKDYDRQELKYISNYIEENERKLEEKISNKVGLDSNQILINKPKKRVKDLTDKIQIKTSNGDIISADKLSPIIKNLDEINWHNNKIIIYSPKDKTKEVRKHSEKILNNLTDTK